MKASFLTLLACLIIFTGCLRNKSVIVIPDKDTAAEQYIFAQKKIGTGIPPTDKIAKKHFYDKQQDLFQKVIDRFPDDAIYTPNSVIEIANILYKKQQNETLIRYLRTAMPLYKDHPNFEPRALLKIGRAQDRLRKHELAKKTYQDCIYRFEDSENPQIKEIVSLARRYRDILYDTTQN